MSSDYYDGLYTLVPKPTATETIEGKPSVSYTIIVKATSPTITIISDPCLEPLAILTEHSIEILHEDSRTMTKEG